MTDDKHNRPRMVAHETEVLNRGGGGTLIGTAQGAVKGYCLGLTICTSETYASTGIHDDQEGFYVIEGHGMARMGDVEFEIRPGTAFLAKAGMPHSVRKFPDSVPLKLLWSHGAV